MNFSSSKSCREPAPASKDGNCERNLRGPFRRREDQSIPPASRIQAQVGEGENFVETISKCRYSLYIRDIQAYFDLYIYMCIYICIMYV